MCEEMILITYLWLALEFIKQARRVNPTSERSHGGSNKNDINGIDGMDSCQKHINKAWFGGFINILLNL